MPIPVAWGGGIKKIYRLKENEMFANMPTSKDLSLIAFFKKYLLLKLFMMLLIAKGQTAIVLSFNFVPVDYPLTISLLFF